MWLAAAFVLISAIVPCAAVCARADLPSALAALTVIGVLCVLALVALTVAFARQSFIDLAVVLAPLSMIGVLAFVRFLDREGRR